MLSIGRALMTHPELIILDEATEGLAPLIVAEVWRVIAQIRAAGIATLIVDRAYRKVLAQSDRALVLQKGQVVLQGESSTLRDSSELAAFLGVYGQVSSQPGFHQPTLARVTSSPRRRSGAGLDHL